MFLFKVSNEVDSVIHAFSQKQWLIIVSLESDEI